MPNKSTDDAARALYAADGNKVKPTWDDLGDVTRSVWRERVKAEDRAAAQLAVARSFVRGALDSLDSKHPDDLEEQPPP